MEKPNNNLADSTSSKEIDGYVKNLYHEKIWLDTSDETNNRANAISSLIKIGSPQAMSPLVREWGRWVTVGNDPSLADLTEQLMRDQPAAIRPLIALFEKGLEADLGVKGHIEYSTLFLKGESEESLKKAWQNNKEWKALCDQHQKVLKLAWDESLFNLRRRIAQLLVDLSTLIIPDSDLKTSANNEEGADVKLSREIRSEFAAYAVTPIVRILDKESDLVIRECFARVLGNINNKPATEALIHAVKGEGQRFSTLDQYYLKPAREKSSEARAILNGVVDQSKQTLKYLQWMNMGVFALGITVLAVGIFMSLFNKDLGTRIASSIAGLGGLAGVITYLITTPLNRIQNALSNLAQIETAFYSFIWELDISDTYIQSQYVAKGVLSDEDIDKTMERIQNVSCSTVDLIESYTEEGREPHVSYITAISPPVGMAKNEISIKGKFQSQARKKKKSLPVIAFNHKPFPNAVASSLTDEVRFIVPPDAIGSDIKEATVWVSVVDNGVETNALPFQLIRG